MAPPQCRASIYVLAWVSLWFASCAYNTGIRPKPPFAAAGSGVLVIAHRGGSLEVPENTLAAMRHGAEIGSDWQELDVALSRDERVVVMHDDRVDRTTDGQGRVDSMTVASLKALHAGKPRWGSGGAAHVPGTGVTPPEFGEMYASEHVPTLEDVLQLPNTRLLIELKKGFRPARLAAAVVQAIHQAGASDRVALASRDFGLADAVHQLDPSLPLVGIVDSAAAVEKMLDLPISALAAEKAILAPTLAAAPPGVAVWAWTAYTLAEAEDLAGRGAHGIITDSPTAVLRHYRSDDALAGLPQ